MSMMVGARSTRSSEINVTPLIDVLLVLLIIFMVILPEHKMGEDAGPAAQPGKRGASSRVADCHPTEQREREPAANPENQPARSILGRIGSKAQRRL